MRWPRGPGPPAALEGAWYQAASFRGGRGKLRARDGHRGESAASFTWLHDRHGVNIFVSASYVGTGCRRAGPPPKAGPAQAAVDSATEAPESGWFLAYSSSLGRRVIGEIIPESCYICVRNHISKRDRERLKQASQGLLTSLHGLLAPMPGWLQNATTQAEVKIFILDRLYESLPQPPFTEAETEDIASRVYDYVWQRSANGQDLAAVGS